MDIKKIKDEITALISSQTNLIHSSQTFRQYVEYSQKKVIFDEETVVQPFTISFLKSLNYVNQHNLTIEEAQKGNKPDFHSDRFIFECKSSSYKDFSERMGREESPREQLERYLKSIDFFREFGIIFNLDRLEVFRLIDNELENIENLSFSLVNFFEKKSTNFDNFISQFYVSPITTDDKIKIIAETQKEKLIPISPKIFNKIVKSLINEISLELGSHFVELNEADDNTKLIKAKICEIKKQMDLKTTNEAEKEYLAQTSYIVLARILLTKCWEDFGLIEPPNTYNGGFKKYIQEYNESIEEVYKRALEKSQDIYFLFNPDNPYLLLKLTEELIADILFQLCKYDFNTLNYDVLGYIYEDYLDLEHRKKYGQYYTPPHVVNLILDRVGYKPLPNKLLDGSLLDPASGSGTFLLNAVRRVLDSKRDGRDHSLDYKLIIENNIFGSELMLFPYLISEINILIQASQELKKIMKHEKVLNVLHVFPNDSFNLIDKTIITRITDLPEDKIKGDTIMDSAIIKRKEDKLKALQHKIDLDYVVGNPPYVANDTNPELFREMREKFTFCEETYHNKMDLFYWFIILGILKLRSGGKLCYITTRYWLDKGEKTGVETLKKYILDHCFLREVIDLRNINVFVSATGQENIIFTLERKDTTKSDDFIKIFRIQPRPNKEDCKFLDCLFERGYCINDQEYLECLCSKESQWDDLIVNPDLELGIYINTFKSAKKTSDLQFNRSWDIFHPGKGTIKEIIDSIFNSCSRTIEEVDPFGIKHVKENVIKFIKDFFTLRVGVMTTIDEVFILTPEILKVEGKKHLLKIESTQNLKISEKKNLLESFDGEVDPLGYVWLELSDLEKKRLLDLYKTPAVYRHGLDASKIVGKLIFLDDVMHYSKCPVLVRYLSQFKQDITAKLEEYGELTPTRPNKWITIRRSASITLVDNTKRDLYEYYCKNPKIFYNYRVGNNNIFGFANKQMVAATDIYFFHKYGEKINTYYVLAYLNSKIITFYFKERPIELNRQKSNVENDIPIFIPRNEPEKLMQKIIVQKEKELTRKLQRLEKSYRTKGFHFYVGQETEEILGIEVQRVCEGLKLSTIEELSHVIKGDIDRFSINRKDFPILIKKPHNTEKIGEFVELVLESDVIFKYKSLEIIVHKKMYEKFKLTLESYLSFSESYTLPELLMLKVPNDKIMDVIKAKRELLNEKISMLNAEKKLLIEKILTNILELNDITEIKSINTINEIIYFIDLSFVKMMASNHTNEIMTY